MLLDKLSLKSTKPRIVRKSKSIRIKYLDRASNCLPISRIGLYK